MGWEGVDLILSEEEEVVESCEMQKKSFEDLREY